MDNDEGIKKYFAAFHLHDNFPRTVVIDDFGDLFDERYVLVQRTLCPTYSPVNLHYYSKMYQFLVSF